MAQAQLRAGHDALVPQYLGRLELVETLQQLAADHDKLLAVVAARPATRVISTIDEDIDGTYAELLTRHLSRDEDSARVLHARRRDAEPSLSATGRRPMGRVAVLHGARHSARTVG
ncbi:MAG: hypothetical protein ACRDQA_11035 [Nocardioidaceae bacterium]